MPRRLLYQRIVIVYAFLAVLFLSANLSSSVLSLNQNDSGKFSPTQPNIDENATFIFYLNSSTITRGVDDLILFFQFTYQNSSFIPNSYIYYNITNPLDEILVEKTLTINTSEVFNETIPWTVFVSQPEGNYIIFSVANSSTTGANIIQKSFSLKILTYGRIRMSFPENPAYLTRNQNNDVPCLITNIGGNTVINVTLTNEITKTGTKGSVTRSSTVTELTIESGETYVGNISFYPDTYLYQKHSFTITYRWIDEPSEEQLFLSDPLAILCLPDLEVSRYNIPANLTVGKNFRITYNVENYELEDFSIVPYAQCDEVVFDENDVGVSIVVSPGVHQFSIVGLPSTSSSTFLLFWVELEWETIAGTKWYSTLLSTVLIQVDIAPASKANALLSPIFIYSVIFTSLIIGIAYFSRDVIKGLAGMRRKEPKNFPEATYPLDTVILDGSNIAWEEKNLSDKPRISNIEAMINKLSKANFKKIITVADAALRYQIDNQKRLDKLVKEGAIKMLPARVDGDKFILRLAEEENAMIVSNDLFKEFREASPWIDQRRIPYTILDGEVYLHPTSAKIETEEKIEDKKPS